MTAQERLELVAIGDELLDGRTRDINAYWLGEQLAREGRSLDRATLVGDSPAAIRDALVAASERAHHVIVSGGLGPTDDDRTRAAAASFMGVSLVENDAILAELKRRYQERGYTFAPVNQRQARFPEGAEVLPTDVGTAPGFRVRAGAATIDFVPGVPREFRWFAERYWLPRVIRPDRSEVVARRWQFFGLGESQVGQAIEGTEPAELSVHYTARFPEVHVVAKGVGKAAHSALETFDGAVRERLGAHLIGIGDASLPERVGKRLVERGWRLTTAESCTGGQIGEVITSVSGSSAYYDEGAITYSNQAKVARLGVRAETLERHGAVAAETAIEMALGARSRAGADLAVSVTGIAGPTGGTPDKPVGTVFVALATPGHVFVRRLGLAHRSRGQIRTWSVWTALTGVLWVLEERLPGNWERTA